MEKILSVFVDESGDFGKVNNASPYYIVTLVLHNQSEDLKQALEQLESSLSYMDLDFSYIHTAPIIRREVPYHNMAIDERRQLLYKMRCFFLHAPIKHNSIIIDRKTAGDKFALSTQLSKQIKSFVSKNYDYFSSFDKVNVYYDNGQTELNLVLNTILSMLLSNVEFRKASPGEYRLLQLADFVCSIELLSLKQQENRLSKSESSFFYKPQELKKSFIKTIAGKRM